MKEFLDKIQEQTSKNIALDFDGVIHQNSKGFHDGTIYDDPVPGTRGALEFLSKDYNLIIFSCKANPNRPLVNEKGGEQLIWEWLKKHDLDQYISFITYVKPRAKYYIDDKAIKFATWKQTLGEVIYENIDNWISEEWYDSVETNYSDASGSEKDLT